MSQGTKIEFCHETINPMGGCSRCSPGCKNCWAVRMAHRHGGNPKLPQYHGLTTYKPGLGPDWTGEVRWFPGVLEREFERLSRPRCKPRRIAMCLMTDLFHQGSRGFWVLKVFKFMRALPRHRFIVITKRPKIMYQRIGDFHVLPNVMLMATVEDQERLEERGPHLLRLALAGWHTGFIVEPMLGGLDFSVLRHGNDPDLPVFGTPWGPEWIVCGMEQGPGKRMMPPRYGAELAKECRETGVPFFFKKDSWGGNNYNGSGSCPIEQFPDWMEV